jgi:hypothetical protein
MIRRSVTRQLTLTVMTVAMLGAGVSRAEAQQKPQEKPRPRPASTVKTPQKKRSVEIGGYGMFGNINFTASESFDAIVGSSSGPIYGGGARIGVPYGGLFIDVGAWRYGADGERVFVANDQVFHLGIPLQITVVPIEFSGGWQFHIRKLPKLLPYVAGGLTSMSYKETSDFATDAENVDERFTGYHLFGGAEYKVTRWLGIAGEATWTTVPDAIGEAGVSASFNETDLGGTTFRFKITVGR